MVRFLLKRVIKSVPEQEKSTTDGRQAAGELFFVCVLQHSVISVLVLESARKFGKCFWQRNSFPYLAPFNGKFYCTVLQHQQQQQQQLGKAQKFIPSVAILFSIPLVQIYVYIYCTASQNCESSRRACD